jgi:hypothetical protein
MGERCNTRREIRNVYKIWDGKPGWERPLGTLDTNERIKLNWILGKGSLGLWIGFIWLMIGTGGGLLCTW